MFIGYMVYNKYKSEGTVPIFWDFQNECYDMLSAYGSYVSQDKAYSDEVAHEQNGELIAIRTEHNHVESGLPDAVKSYIDKLMGMGCLLSEALNYRNQPQQVRDWLASVDMSPKKYDKTSRERELALSKYWVEKAGN